ncbi:MAG: radical SAM protein [Bacteroidales bacterium]|nr:radical SAM protein [Bacteroidales bacterium]
MSENQKLVCHYPWTSMYVSPTGDVKHCCYTYHKSLGNLSNCSIEEIWNGEKYKSIREKIANGDFDGAFCSPNCSGLAGGAGYPWPVDTYSLNKTNEVIGNNEKKAKQSFENGDKTVSHFPTELHLELTNNCNLRCIMCFYPFKPPYNFISEDALDKLIDISKYANAMVMMGGEIFINKQDLRFIEEYSAPDGASMGFVSNGTMLKKEMVEKLKKFKAIGMQISIDGTTPEVYARVRKRSDWEVVDENIKHFVATANELKEQAYIWNTELAFVVLKQNVANMAHSVEYAAKLNVPIIFNIVSGFHLFEENIFVYKKAYKEAGDCMLYLQEAYDMLEKYKDSYEHYDTVSMWLKRIENGLKRPKIKHYKITVALLNLFVKGEKRTENQTGVSDKELRVGHVMEVLYNLRYGNMSFGATVRYVFMKVFKKKKK